MHGERNILTHLLAQMELAAEMRRAPGDPSRVMIARVCLLIASSIRIGDLDGALTRALSFTGSEPAQLGSMVAHEVRRHRMELEERNRQQQQQKGEPT